MQRASDLLEKAIHCRRLAQALEDPGAAAELVRVAMSYLEMAERAHERENAGKEIRGR
jgi:hypothetical protein